MESVDNSGTFTDISCPRLLVRLHLARFTGTLRISQGAVLKFLYFQTGEIAMASSNDQGDHLAPILMRSGKLKAEQLDLARKQAQPGTSLARVLVQMGFLTSGELFSGARQQLRQIVGSVLALTEGRYEIQSQYFPREITSLNVETRELLLELVQDLPERSFVLLEVGAPDTVYFAAPAAAPPTLPKRWQDWAGRFIGPMTIHAFGQATGLDDFAASKTVYGLHLFGLLEKKPEEFEAAAAPEEVPEGAPEEAAGGEAVPGPPAAAAQIPEPGSPAAFTTVPETQEMAGPGEAKPWNAPAEPDGAPVTGPSHGAAAPEQAVDLGPVPAPWPSHERGGEGKDFVAQGEPIRLEFRGPPTPTSPPPRFAGSWGIFSVIAGIAILVAAFAWFVFLKESPPSGSPSPISGERASETPESRFEEAGPPTGTAVAVADHEEEDPGSIPADEPSPVESAEPADRQAGVHSSPAGAEGLPGAVAEGHPEEEAASEALTGREPQTGDRGRAEVQDASEEKPVAPPAAAQKVSAAPPFAAADRFREARARLDAGDYAVAAGSWLETALRETKKVFTLQIAIACQEESLRKAARRTRGSADFFIVPFSLEGRPCYRLCWGAYASREEAVSGKTSVPDFFLAEGGKPLVVSLGKLAPPERR